jgi:hypothetical protein
MPSSIADSFKNRLDQLIKEDQESQAKTQATLQRLRELIKTVESIEFED